MVHGAIPMQVRTHIISRDSGKPLPSSRGTTLTMAIPTIKSGPGKLAPIWACQAGKDVYVEKCISLNIGEGQKMIEAAMKYERIVQCGTQNRSADFALSAKDYIKNGQLGQVVSVNVMGLLNGPVPFNEKKGGKAPDTIDWNMWLGPAPEVPYSVSRNKSNLFYWDYSRGLALGNGSDHVFRDWRENRAWPLPR